MRALVVLNMFMVMVNLTLFLMTIDEMFILLAIFGMAMATYLKVGITNGKKK